MSHSLYKGFSCRLPKRLLRACLLAPVTAITFLFAAALAAKSQGPPPIVWIQGGDAEAVAYSPNGTMLAAGVNGSAGGELALWDIATQEVIGTFPTTAVKVSSVAYSPDGQSIAVGGKGETSGVIEIWTVATGALAHTFVTGATAGVTSVQFSPDGTTLAAGGANATKGIAELWNLTTLKAISVATKAALVQSLAWSADSSKILVGGQTTTAGIIEGWSKTGTLQHTFTSAAAKGVQALAVSPDITKFAAGGSYADSSGNHHGVLEETNFATNAVTTLATNASIVNSVAYTSTGATLIAGGDHVINAGTQNYSGVVELWTVSTGTLSKSLGSALHGVTSVSVSGTTAFALGGQGITELWSLTTDLHTASLGTGTDFAGAILSVDGKTVGAGGGNGSNSIDSNGANNNTGLDHSIAQLWSATTGKLLHTLTSEASRIEAGVFSPDGTLLADGGRLIPGTNSHTYSGILEVWTLATDTKIELPTTISRVREVTFSPDSKLLAVCGDNWGTAVIEVWSMPAGTLSYTLPAPANYRSIRWSPDGKTLAVGGTNSPGGFIDIWNVATKTKTTTFTSVSTGGVAIAWSIDSKYLASVGQYTTTTNVYHGSLEIWNVATKAKVDTIEADLAAYSVAFSPDGKDLFIGTDQGIHIYNTSNWAQTQMYNEECQFTTALSFPPVTSVSTSASTHFVIGRADGSIALIENPGYVGTPIATAQTVTVALNTAKSITLAGTDPDTPPLELTYAVTTKPAHGTLGALNTATGVVTYTPTTGYKGIDTFKFTVTNGVNTSAAATVTLNVGD